MRILPLLISVRHGPAALGGKMRFCDAEACNHCLLADGPNVAPCLRQKAQFCMWLSTMPFAGNPAALEKLSLDLMDEACAVDKELNPV
jgi:hypothetical protein